MEKELEQEAVQTFAAAPEIYQQAFKNAGADFPDELVTEIKKDPNQAVDLLNSDKNLKQAVINIYKSNKDAIVKYIQQAKSMFKDGGKFDYLKKLQHGGNTTQNGQDSIVENKNYKLVPTNKNEIPTSYIVRNDQQFPVFSYDDYAEPQPWDNYREIDGYGGYSFPYSTTVLNLYNRFPFGIVGKEENRYYGGIEKQGHSGVRGMQEGGNLTRRQMFEQASKNRGFSRSDTRRAFRNARNAGLDRQTAMNAVINSAPETTAVLNRPQLIDNIETPIGQISTTKETISIKPTPNYDNIDFGVFNFGKAFNKARSYGLKEFNWNNNRYTTELAKPTELTKPAEETQPEFDFGEFLNRATEPIVEDIRWNNEHRPYWADLKKQGGKLAKENEINKKYIKDSEEAGAKASKEMSDLKAKHKKEILKLKKK